MATFVIGAVLAQQQPTSQSSVLVTTYSGSDEVYLWGQGLPDGRHFEYVLSSADFAKLPEWAPEKEAPPLAIGRAIEVAKKATRAEHPEFTDLMPWSIQIQQVGSQQRQTRWFYIVMLYPIVKGEPSIYSHVTVVVLMNGVVVKPREAKGSLK